MTVTIRQAKPYDASNICRLLEQAVNDHEGLYPEPDQHMAINWVVSVLTEGYVVVAEKSGRLIGSVALTNYRFPWSPKWYLYVDWIFVSRNFREGGVADALIRAMSAFADEKGAPIYAGVSSGKDPRLKDRLLKMKGYTYLGGQFIREIASEEQAVERQQENDDD